MLNRLTTHLIILLLAGCALGDAKDQSVTFNPSKSLNDIFASEGATQVISIALDETDVETFFHKYLPDLKLLQAEGLREEFRIEGLQSTGALHLGVIRLDFYQPDDLARSTSSFREKGYLPNTKILTPYESASNKHVLCIVYSESALHPHRQVAFAKMLDMCTEHP